MYSPLVNMLIVLIQLFNPTTNYISNQKELDEDTKRFIKNNGHFELFIHKEYGVFYVKDGPGVTPITTHYFNKEDLMQENEFLFFLNPNQALIPEKYFINPDVDRCNLTEEGYYIFDVKKNSNYLSNLYEIQQLQKGEGVDKEQKKLYNTIDTLLKKVIIIRFLTKTGDTFEMTFYLAKEGENLFVSAIDITTCGT